MCNILATVKGSHLILNFTFYLEKCCPSLRKMEIFYLPNHLGIKKHYTDIRISDGKQELCPI